MNSYEKRIMKQKAVYWPPGDFDEYGRPKTGTAVELSVRWEMKNQEFIDPQNTRQVSTAVILVPVDVAVGGLLYLGTLVETEEASFPSDVRQGGAVEILQFQKTPDRRVTRYVRRAMV